MNVYVYPADLEGTGYYRLIWAALELRKQGHSIKIISPQHTQRLVGVPDGTGQLQSISTPSDADVLVFQRVASKMFLRAIDIWQAHGIAVVMDIDDDMRTINQSNAAWLALHPRGEGLTEEYSWNVAQVLMEKASFVTVSSDALLKRYAHHGRGVVIRNAVPEAALGIVSDPEPGTIGWGGGIHSHPDDPQVVGASMARLQREGFKFKVVGPPRGVRSAFMLDEEPPTTGSVPLHRWPHELAKLSVGIAPLNDTRFNASKSWLKMLEYAAVGVACVGSPRDEYRKLHALGVGLLADNPKNWYRHCRRLLTDDALREDVADRGRAAVADLTIEKNAWRWLEAWSRGLEYERGPLGRKRPQPTTRTPS